MINSRKKGHNFEREVTKFMNNLIAEYTKSQELVFRRVPLSGGFDKDHFPGDIVPVDPVIAAKWDMSIECKSHKEYRIENLILPNKMSKIWEWMRQAYNDASSKAGILTPVVIFKKNNGQPFAAFTKRDWQTAWTGEDIDYIPHICIMPNDSHLMINNPSKAETRLVNEAAYGINIVEAYPLLRGRIKRIVK